MFIVVLLLHWGLQKLFGWKPDDEAKAESTCRNNSADNSGQAEMVQEEEIIHAASSNSTCAVPTAPADVSNVYGETEFPFLSHAATVDFLKCSHVMFIMRGLPGSGKSSLVTQLQQTYPNATVCSADHFFTDAEGNYRFDVSKLSEAHEQCQQRASDACARGQRTLIIDNTNIQAWTMSHYLGLAQYTHFYHCIIVEPNTPWRYDPEQLAVRNTHNVEKQHIANKVKLIRDKKFLPTYYGWFLSRADSTAIVALWQEAWQLCCASLPDGLVVDGELIKKPQDFQYFVDQMYTIPHKMLHCTARFLGSNTKDSYHARSLVRQAMGRRYSLKVTGFAFSERNVSALIDLGGDSETLDLFVKPEEEFYRDKHRDDVTRPDSEQVFHHGCSAHLTITFRVGGKPQHSGDDILEMCELGYLGQGHTVATPLGFLTGYRGNLYRLELNTSLVLDCLFHGFYSMRGHR